MLKIFEPKPDNSDVAPFAKCPSCRQLIKLDLVEDTIIIISRNCPFCASYIEKDEINDSYKKYLKGVRALQSAKDVISNDYILFVLFGMVFLEMIIIHFIKNMFPLLQLFIFVFSGIVLALGYIKTQMWLDKFGFLLMDDEGFTAAKKEVKRSRLIWLIAIIFNLALWFLFIKYF
jgi:hypothetical protein